jgi:putative transposase
MPRVARIVVPGFPHHVTQRGNNGQDVFFVDDDRRMYLRFLRHSSLRFGLSILGYCLMTNHVHVIGVPSRLEALAKAIGRTHFLYTQYVNRLHGRVGHLWQNRFYSCPMDESHSWTALSYVERNPLRGGLVRAPWQYPWSSARVHAGVDSRDSVWLDLEQWSGRWTPEQWRGILQQPHDEALVAAVRRNTHSGRPLADDTFLSKLECELGRRIRPLSLGRPKGVRTPWRRDK